MNLNSFFVISGRKIRIGVVGCGRISKNHFASIIDNSDDLELVAVCDTNSEALGFALKEYGV